MNSIFFYFERILQLDNQPRYLVALLCVLLLSLNSRKVELGRLAIAQSLPVTKIASLIPSKKSNPGLDIVVQLELNVLRCRNLTSRVGNLILWFLVLETKEATDDNVRLQDRRLQRHRDLPVGVDSFSFSAALELLHSHGTNILEMVGAGVRNDLVPDNSLVGRIVGSRPLGGNIYEYLLSVPCEEASQIGVQVESNNCIFLLLGAVVVRSSLDTEK